MTTVHDCAVVELQRIHNPKGNITVVEKGRPIAFDVKRVYYLYDVPGGEGRGGHAHRQLRQLVVAAMGAFDVVLDDGRERRTVSLNRAYQGLLIVPMIWREVVNFSSGGVCLVLASTVYDEADYIREYPAFVQGKLASVGG
jgi:hypothetical protein